MKSSLWFLLLVFSFLLLAGCTLTLPSSNPNPSDSNNPSANPNNPSANSNDNSNPLGSDSEPDSDSTNPPEVDEAERIIKDSSSTIAEQSAAMKILIEAGVPINQLPSDVVERIKEWVRFVLSDPSSTPQFWLDALHWAESLGVKDQELTDAVQNKIKTYIEGVLTNTSLCKGRLIELSELAKAANLTELSNQCMNRAASAPLQCSSVTKEYLTKNYSVDQLLRVSALGGTLKEATILGHRNPDALTYYWSDGLLTWEFDETTFDSCATIVRKGSGSEVLDSYEDGYVSVFSDGTYSGSIIGKSVNVHVTVTPTGEPGCEETAQSYDEPLGLTLAAIEGTWIDTGRLHDSLNESWVAHPDTDDFTGHQKVEWDLSLPN